jgi:hypothetical protein
MSNDKPERSDRPGATIRTVNGAAEAKPQKDRAKALYDDATEDARRLKRKHRAYFQRDPKSFRATVKKAHGRIYRLKPGPRTDPRIETAARDRVRGTQWPALYAAHIDNYPKMSEFTRALAEDGFRKKVNSYLQHHPARKRKWQTEICKTNSA